MSQTNNWYLHHIAEICSGNKYPANQSDNYYLRRILEVASGESQVDCQNNNWYYHRIAEAVAGVELEVLRSNNFYLHQIAEAVSDEHYLSIKEDNFYLHQIYENAENIHPPAPKTDTLFTIQTPTIVYTDEFSVTGTLTTNETTPQPIAGATVKLVWGYDDNSYEVEGTTANDGTVTFARSAVTTVASYKFKLVYEGDSSYNSCMSSQVSVTPDYETSILNVSSYTASVYSDGTITVSGRLATNDDTQQSPEPITGATIVLMEGATTLDSVRTGNDGTFTSSFNISSSGSHTVSVIFDDTEIYSGSDEDISITVNSTTLVLLSDKSILSYADNDSATLTATLNAYDNVGKTVTFEVRKQSDDSLVETLTGDTDSSGIATVSYLGKHAKSIYIKAISGNFYDIVQIEDIYFYREQEYSYTKTSSNINSLIDPNLSLTLPTNCEITFNCKCSGGTSSNEHRFFLLPKSEFSNGVQPAHGVYWQNTGGSNGSWGTRNNSSNQVGTFNFPTNTYISIKLVKQGNNIVFYVDNSSKGSVNMPINMSNYTNWTFSIHLWNDGTGYLKNLKIEEL